MKDAVSESNNMIIVVKNVQLPGLGSAGGFSGKKRGTLIILLITPRQELFTPLKSAVYQKNQKWTLKAKILNPNKFFILQRRNQIPMMITYKKRVK
jgi:prolyl oligopeptidase